MKIKIITKDGVHTEIEPKFIQVNNKSLEQILRDYREIKNELVKFKSEMLKREEELLKLWVKIH